jgi:hypothetical protein
MATTTGTSNQALACAASNALDASVPFSFDVHAMIRSQDAPTLEPPVPG